MTYTLTPSFGTTLFDLPSDIEVWSTPDQPLGATAISLDVVAGDTLYLETDGSVADVTDVRFVVEYQS